MCPRTVSTCSATASTWSASRPVREARAARTRVRAELGVDDDAVVVGAVGRLVWEKGYRELFVATEQLRRRCPEVTVVVAGPHEPEKADGIGPEALAAAESSGVRFLGHRSDVEDLYAAFDVYVLASYREGFPRSAMEAAAMGLPVVATDIRGCRQVVEHGVTGLLVPPHDAAALTDAVVRLAGDSGLRTTMGDAAVAKAKRDFDQRQVIATTLGVYEELLERKERGGRSPQATRAPRSTLSAFELGHGGMPAMGDPAPAQDDERCLQQNAEVEGSRAMFDVPGIECEFLVPGECVATPHLDQAGQARLDLQAPRLRRRILGRVGDGQGTGADEVHLAPDHVPQFRQLVQAGTTEQATDPGDAGGVGLPGELGGAHGAELQETERPAV